VGGTNTGPSVLDGLAMQLSATSLPAHRKHQGHLLRDRELGEVVANHLRLDLDLVELLSRVHTNDGTNHLRDNDHVAEVGLDEVGLLVGAGLLLRLTELLDQTHWLALETAVETTAGAGVDDIAELLAGEVEEPVRLQLAEYPLCAA
jgi:hypothetical protein